MDDDSTGAPEAPPSAGGYMGFQMARALAAAGHADAAISARAARRIGQWASVIRGHRDGTIATGSRTPVKDVPAWVTLEVVTGGYSTGALLGGGLLRPHERLLRDELAPAVPEADVRLALNSFFLSDAGLERLQSMLASGRFAVEVPEEGALLVVAWLVQAGRVQEARALADVLSPWFSALRFYPLPAAQAREYGERIWVEDVAAVTQRLREWKPNRQILAQKEAIQTWRPMYDAMVGLWLETVVGEVPVALKTEEGGWQQGDGGRRFAVIGGWPCAHYPEGWRERAVALLDECKALRADHGLCARSDSFNVLRKSLRRCVSSPQSLSGREVGRLRLILARYIAKRGPPDAAQRLAWQQQRSLHAGAPTFEEVAHQVAGRLGACAPDEGLEDIAAVLQPIDAAESAASGIAAGTQVPPSVARKVGRCQAATAAELVERGIVPSGEVLAQVLPPWTAALRAADVQDPVLRRVYAAIYRAFSARRSLLLLNLQKQVRIEELPWVAAIDAHREKAEASGHAAKQALTEASQLAIAAFPQAILPNKLLKELRALSDAAQLGLPLVDEVAADIFMGRFAPKFLASAQLAAQATQRSLYARYYGIDTGALLAMPPAKTTRSASTKPDAFASLCATRAGARLGGGGVAKNGMVIEQAQILTTHNLAVLFTALGLRERLEAQLPELARRCFAWVCKRLQVPADSRHVRLIQIKNTAYAWRQMVFFISLCSADEIGAFIVWAREHLGEQETEFRALFGPALEGLSAAASAPDASAGGRAERDERQCFVGWSDKKHWLMPAQEAAASAQ